MIDIIVDFFHKLSELETNQITLISIAISLLLFALGKISENRIKIYETRKEEYRKLLELFQEMMSSIGESIDKNSEIKNKTIDVGAALSVFGSKKLYRTYCFYRRLATDEAVQKSKWYSKDMIVYALGEMYRIMRKEIGLNRDIIPVDVPDALAFFITDFSKPEFKKNYYKYRYNKFVLNSIILWGKIEEFVPLICISNYVIKPLLFTLFCIIRFPIKLLIITPVKQIKRAINSKKK